MASGPRHADFEIVMVMQITGPLHDKEPNV
jgi:hypothetical protein